MHDDVTQSAIAAATKVNLNRFIVYLIYEISNKGLSVISLILFRPCRRADVTFFLNRVVQRATCSHTPDVTQQGGNVVANRVKVNLFIIIRILN
jgi:hypothetical protein